MQQLSHQQYGHHHISGRNCELGHKRALTLFLSVLVLASLSMGLLPKLWEQTTFITGHMLIHHLFRTLALVTCFSIGMALCWKTIAATQFAIYMTFGNLGISAGSILMGQAATILSYPQIVFLIAGLAALGILVGSRLNLAEHQKRIQQF